MGHPLPLNILYIIISLDVGGAELMLQRLVESRRADPGVRQTVVALTTLGEVGARLQARGIDVRALGIKGAWGALTVVPRLVRLMRRIRPDVVQTWMYHADLLGGLAARLAGIRAVVWGVRSTLLPVAQTRTTETIRKICARLSRWLPHTIVCAAEASMRFHVAMGYDAARMVVIPNGFDLATLVADPAQRDALVRRLAFPPGTVVVGSVGRFDELKDHATFVRAAGLLAQRRADVRFLLVGRNLDAHNGPLQQWIAATGHADRFVLLGERSDVPVCLAAMDVFCLHSRSEGFPNVVGEAMAMGLPCVVTDVGDAAELVRDTGTVVPKQDPQALAQALDALIALPAGERRALGQRARERIHTEFTIQRARERFDALYAKVMQS